MPQEPPDPLDPLALPVPLVPPVPLVLPEVPVQRDPLVRILQETREPLDQWVRLVKPARLDKPEIEDQVEILGGRVLLVLLDKPVPPEQRDRTDQRGPLDKPVRKDLPGRVVQGDPPVKPGRVGPLDKPDRPEKTHHKDIAEVMVCRAIRV